MKRLYVVVEGSTEETFVNELLAEHLRSYDIDAIPIQAALNRPKRRRVRPARGGWCSYRAVEYDIMCLAKQQVGNDVRITTMLDMFALPRDFPGYRERSQYPDPHQRVQWLEGCFSNQIGDWRFIPYLQLHEYEALLFSNIDALTYCYPGLDSEIAQLRARHSSYASPEHINNRKPPSKRILAIVPQYDKVFAGALTAISIGLTTIRKACPHFNEWVTRLEEL